ncbi:ABC transporter permease [Bacillus spongiae]|uniref:ABC transporter permease n=1 Tax=Bacillus spongiae TaxID=2683610 RepID=A0ABU8HB16_9BACI
MKSIDSIWKRRVADYNKELQKYLRYMFNDHLLFVLIFALGAGAYTYNEWVDTLDGSFPAEIIMAMVLGSLLVWSPLYTFLKEADAVYLLPMEEKMRGYFQKSLFLSFLFQTYAPLLVLAALMPMYVQVSGVAFSSFFLIFGAVLLIKGWNIFVKWNVLKSQDSEVAVVDGIIRLLLNITLLFFILERASYLFILILALVYLAYGIYFYRTAKGRTLQWERLIDIEVARLLQFYRLANLFTDVPKLKGKVYRRKWLDPFLQKAKFEQKESFTYLYSRTFYRSSEFLGLFIRLTMISMLLLYVNDWVYFQLFISVLFLYLTGFQLIPLVKKHSYVIWISLYPISMKERRRAFLALIQKLMFIQSALFALIPVLAGQWQNGVLILVVNLVISLMMVSVYIPKRIQKTN